MKRLLFIIMLLPFVGWSQNTAIYRRENINQQFATAKGAGTIIQLIDSAGNTSSLRLYELTHAVTATDSMKTVFRNNWYKAPAGGGGGGGTSCTNNNFTIDCDTLQIPTLKDYWNAGGDNYVLYWNNGFISRRDAAETIYSADGGVVASNYTYSIDTNYIPAGTQGILSGFLGLNYGSGGHPYFNGGDGTWELHANLQNDDYFWQVSPNNSYTMAPKSAATRIGLGLANNGNHILAIGANANIKDALNLVYTPVNKNRSTLAQCRDSSSLSVSFTPLGRVQLCIRDKDSSNVFRIDSTGRISGKDIRTMAGGGYDSTQMILTGFLPMVLGVSDGIIVDTVYMVGVGAAVDVDIKLYHGASLASGTAIDNTAFTCNSVTTGVKWSSGFESATIPAGSFIWATITEATTKCRRIAIIVKGHKI